jgi:hypothetical protein
MRAALIILLAALATTSNAGVRIPVFVVYGNYDVVVNNAEVERFLT